MYLFYLQLNTRTTDGMSHTTKHKMAALLVLLLQLGTAKDLQTPSLADVISSAGLSHNSHYFFE